jgi:DNA-binding transcriptional LysR family regulator
LLDRFQGLQVLLKVVELASLSGAARALRMSPTMATKHVAALEDRLGVRLLHRTTRKVTPTEIGRRQSSAFSPIFRTPTPQPQPISLWSAVCSG